MRHQMRYQVRSQRRMTRQARVASERVKRARRCDAYLGNKYPADAKRCDNCQGCAERKAAEASPQ